MALWKESAPTASPPSPSPAPVASPLREMPIREPERAPNVAPVATTVAPRPKERVEGKESVIASDVSIEGKIDGSGHVRIAGKFKGDVRVDGNLTIDAGAHLTGQVIASVVVVGGELNGNIASAKRVELLETGIISGDVKAGSLTVAAGSRMRGQVEFGWDEQKGSGKHS
jgi:cytoskeletal protein CcmA (bactofilin family)